MTQNAIIKKPNTVGEKGVTIKGNGDRRPLDTYPKMKNQNMISY